MFSHAASQSLPLCFLSKKKKRRWKKHYIRLSAENFFFVPSSKVAGNAVPAIATWKTHSFSLCSSTVQFFFLMLPVMQKKIGVQKGPVWGRHSSACPATYSFCPGKQAGSISETQESWHDLALRWNMPRKRQSFFTNDHRNTPSACCMYLEYSHGVRYEIPCAILTPC